VSLLIAGTFDSSVATVNGKFGKTEVDKPPKPENRRMVAIYGEGLGDAVMSLPALRALSALFTETPILIGPAEPREILGPELPFCSFLKCGEGSEEPIARALARCDLVMNTNPINPIGWAKRDEGIAYINYTGHFSDKLFEFPRFLDSGLMIENFSFSPKLVECGRDIARLVYRKISGNQKVLVVHPDTMASKMWPIDRFQRFLELFLALHPEFVVLVVGVIPNQLELGRFREQVIACQGLPLAASFSLVASADLFVGIDSVMLHVADMCRIPSVGIFGASSPERWGCRFTRHRHVVAANRDLTQLNEEDVLSATENLWSDTIGMT
jgi:ADP-heptose:LPS heptosyltransferase